MAGNSFQPPQPLGSPGSPGSPGSIGSFGLSASHGPTGPSEARAPQRRWLWPAVAVAVLVVGFLCVAGALGWFKGGAAGGPELLTVPVRRGHLTIDISVAGAVRNRDQMIIKSAVEGKTTILQLVDEGTHVKKGDLLIELDSASLVDQQMAQQITAMNAEAAKIQAQETLEVTKLQTASDRAKAELDHKFAEEDLKKYQEGDYPQLERDADTKVTLAEETLKRAQDKLDWSQKLFDKKYLSKTDLSADELDAKKSGLDVVSAQEDRKLLKKYTYQRKIDELNAAVASTASTLECAKRKAVSDLVQAEASFKAKDSEYTRQKDKLDKLVQQIKNCKIVSPIDAMVVYATTGQMNWSRGGGSADPLAEGQDVRERQELIYLPTANSMIAQVKIHESTLEKVKVGMAVQVNIDAVPNRVFIGKVAKIALLPDAQAVWQNPDLKEYSTEVTIDDDSGVLRAGMSCRCRIIVAEYDDALSVPVQSVLRVSNQPTVYVPSAGGPRPVPVQIGLDNNSMVRVLSGLKEGDAVILKPPMQAAAIADTGTRPAQGAGGTAGGTPGGAGGTPVALVRGPAGGPGAPASQPTTAPTEDDPPASPGPATATQPAGKVDLRAMTPEQRTKYLESLTPEQREALLKRMAARRPRRDPDAGP